jgi:hypothetical protein
MMDRQTGDQSYVFYLFNLETHIPAGHLLRRVNPSDAEIGEAARKTGALVKVGRPLIDLESARSQCRKSLTG